MMRDLERHLPTLVLTCERHGARDPRLVSHEYPDKEAFEWFAASAISIHGYPETKRPGAVDVLPDGGAALEAGADVVELQTLLGHASLDTTRRYLDATAEGLREVVRGHPGQVALRDHLRGSKS
jgi:integrase